MSSSWIRTNGQHEVRENIRAAIKEAGLTQSMAASRAGMKGTRLTAFLGANTWFAPDEVEAIAAVLEISPDELLGDSIYRGDPRESAFDFMPEQAARTARAAHSKHFASRADCEHVAEPVEARSRRALCCECGRGRLVGVKLRGPDVVYEGEFSGRMLADYKCDQCGTITRHAILRSPSDEARDMAEDRRPSADDVARNERDELVGRIEAFGVEVHWRSVSNREWRLDNYAPALRAEWDDSKGAWRIDLNHDFPPSLQLESLQETWRAIALDDDDWWPSERRRCVVGPSNDEYNRAIDGLVEEINTHRHAVLRSIVAEVQDEVVEMTDENEEVDW